MTDGGSRHPRLGPSACQEIGPNRRRNALERESTLDVAVVSPRRGMNEAHGLYGVRARNLKVEIARHVRNLARHRSRTVAT